jgi:hypothetical protein
MKLFEKIGNWLNDTFDVIFDTKVETQEEFESRLEQNFGSIVYWDLDEDLFFEGDLLYRITLDSKHPDKNKPNVCIRTRGDITYFIPEEDYDKLSFSEEELHKINLVGVTAYYNGN